MTGGTTHAGLALVHGDLSREIIGAFFDVYNALGYGFFGPRATFRRLLLTSPGDGSAVIRS